VKPWRLFTDPDKAIWTHGILFVFWVAMTIPSVLWWHDSILYVIFISLYAIWVTHVSALQAALADRRIKHGDPETGQEDGRNVRGI
jgi:hypothetical protein